MTFYTYSFEKLEVWKDSKELTKLIYMATEKFPKNEIYVMVSQMRRAAISISSNIAEGCGRTNTKDQAHFYQIAYSSTIELLYQLIISNELQFLNDDQYVETRLVIEKVSNKINALRNKRLSAIPTKQLNA